MNVKIANIVSMLLFMVSCASTTQILNADKTDSSNAVRVFAVDARSSFAQSHVDPAEISAKSRSSLKLDYKNPEAHKMLIRASLLARRPQEALLLSDNALQVLPRESDIYVLKGLAYYFLSDFFSARDLWKKAVEMDSGNIAGHLNLAALYYLNGNLNQAGAGYERVLAVQPRNCDALLGRAAVLDAQGQSGEARAVLQTLASDKPGVALVHYNLAIMERERFENYEKSLEHIEKYIRVSEKERASMEHAIAMRADLRSLIAKKKMGKISDDELRTLAKKSMETRVETTVANKPLDSNTRSEAVHIIPDAGPKNTQLKIVGEDAESLEGAIR